MGATYLTLKDLNEQRRKKKNTHGYLQPSTTATPFSVYDISQLFFDDVHHLDIKSCCYMISSLCERLLLRPLLEV